MKPLIVHSPDLAIALAACRNLEQLMLCSGDKESAKYFRQRQRQIHGQIKKGKAQ